MLLREQVALSRLQQLYDPCGSTKAANYGTWSAAGQAAGGTVSRIPDGPAARGPVARARLDRYTVTNRRSAAAPARKRGCSCYAVASACAFETGVCCGPKVATENASKSGSGQQLQGFCDTREPVGSASEGSRSSRRRSRCRPLITSKTPCIGGPRQSARTRSLRKYGAAQRRRRRRPAPSEAQRARRPARFRPQFERGVHAVTSTARTRLLLAQPRCGTRCTSVQRQAPRPPRSNTGSAAGAALKVASVGKKQATLPSVRLREQAPRFYRRVRGAQLPRKGARRV